MISLARNALHGGVLATALIAVLTVPANAQDKPHEQATERQKLYDDLKKARELEAQEKAYKSATDIIPAKQIPLDPWGNVRPSGAPPAKAAR